MRDDSQLSRYQRYRNRQRGGPARTPKPCGTYAAMKRHRRNPDKYGPLEECEPCLESEQRANAFQAARRRLVRDEGLSSDEARARLIASGMPTE